MTTITIKETQYGHLAYSDGTAKYFIKSYMTNPYVSEYRYQICRIITMNTGDTATILYSGAMICRSLEEALSQVNTLLSIRS